MQLSKAIEIIDWYIERKKRKEKRLNYSTKDDIYLCHG
jgi:hypothetical protein